MPTTKPQYDFSAFGSGGGSDGGGYDFSAFGKPAGKSDSIGLTDVLKAGAQGVGDLVMGALSGLTNADSSLAGVNPTAAAALAAKYQDASPTRRKLATIPVVGPQIADISAPGMAYASGHPPSKQENLDAVRSGTAAAAGLAAPLVAPRVGAAIQARATAAPTPMVDSAASGAAEATPNPSALPNLQRSLPASGIDPATGANAARGIAAYQRISGGAIKSIADVPDAVANALDQATGWKSRNPDVIDPHLDQYISDLQHAQKSLVPVIRQQLAPKPGFAEHPIQTVIDKVATPVRAVVKGGLEPVLSRAVVDKLMPETPQVTDSVLAPFGKRLNAAAASVPVTDRLASLGQSTPPLPEMYDNYISPSDAPTPSPIPVSRPMVGGAHVETLGGTYVGHEPGVPPELGIDESSIPPSQMNPTSDITPTGALSLTPTSNSQLADPTFGADALRARAAAQIERQAAATSIARDTMQSKSFPSWSPEDQQAFGNAMNASDPGAAAATSNIADQRASGISDPTFGAIAHLPDTGFADLYNGHTQAVYVDPHGTVTPLTDLPPYLGKGIWKLPDGTFTQVDPGLESSSPSSPSSPPSPTSDSPSNRKLLQQHLSSVPVENPDLVEATPPRKLLPARFRTTVSTDIAMPRYVGAVEDQQGVPRQEGRQPDGWYGAFSGGGQAWPGQPAGTPGALVSRASGAEWAPTLYHEMGHGAWNDLAPKEQALFEQHARDLWNSTNYDENSAVEQALRRGTTHGEGAGGEFFPEMFSMYVTAPSTLLREDPAGYKLMKMFFGGREYRKGGR